LYGVKKINKFFQKTISFREEIAGQVMKTFQVACDPWGVSVERVEASRIFFSLKKKFTFTTMQHLSMDKNTIALPAH
jgi:hypothetical protein